jgi:hypothetical protein
MTNRARRRARPLATPLATALATPLATPLATAIDLRRSRNADDDRLAAAFHPAFAAAIRRAPAGRQVFRGLPFRLGRAGARRRWLLLDGPIEIDLAGHGRASHLVVAHFCDAWRDVDGSRPADLPVGWVMPVGEELAHYTVETDSGPPIEVAVRRRHEVNDGLIGWGQGAFGAWPHVVDEPLEWRGPHPAQEPVPYAPVGEAGLLAVLPGTWGPDQTGVADSIPSPTGDLTLWLLPIELPEPTRPTRLRLEPVAPPDGGSGVVVAAVTLFRGAATPLEREPRRTLRISRRTGGPGRRAGSREPRSIAVDLGQVIRRRPAPEPIADAGPSDEAAIGWGRRQPGRPATATLVDVAMSPDARIVVDGVAMQARRLAAAGAGRRQRRRAVFVEPLPTPDQRVEVDVVDARTGEPMAARVHFRAADGRYLPPLGHREEVNVGLNEDAGADVVIGDTTYAYVPGRFTIDLPAGFVEAEVVRGFGYRPLRRRIEIDGRPGPIRFALEPIDGPTGEGWVAADCHVHFVSPTSALLQAAAEGVDLVNLLATQWGDHHTSVTDLPVVALGDSGGRHQVVMGSENRQNMLGHVGLLGASGPVLPMASGGAPEGRLGDPLDRLIADWADAARAQGGLAIAVHFPLPYAEVAADIVAGKIEAVELQALTPGVDGPSIREWYRFLNNGFHLPVVGGTDKMTAAIPLGAIRTYARLAPDRELSFATWADAVRAGRTFVSSGPYIELSVDGHEPGDVIHLPRTGGTVEVRAGARSAQPVLDELQVVHDGAVVATSRADAQADALALAERITVRRGGWLAARVSSRRTIHSAFATAMGAHTSPVYLAVLGRPAFDAHDAAAIGAIIDGTRAWIETVATVRTEAERERLAAYFAIARGRLDEIVRERSARRR